MNWLYLLHALTPLHPGVGRGVGLIDLPIARERATDHPLTPGSSVKGVLRDACRQQKGPKLTNALFGPEPGDEGYASALRFSDARIVLFPVRSDRGTFSWVTCPWVLERLRRDAADLGALPGSAVPVPGDGCLVPEGSAIVAGGTATLDGLPFGVTEDKRNLTGQWADALANLVFPPTDRQASAWNALLRARFCIVSDDAFTWLVQNATEVRARIRVDEKTGTVAKGGLWYEEALPAETVLAGLVQYVANSKAGAEDPATTLADLVARPLQVGGHATTGQGVVRLRLHGGDS